MRSSAKQKVDRSSIKKDAVLSGAGDPDEDYNESQCWETVRLHATNRSSKTGEKLSPTSTRTEVAQFMSGQISNEWSPYVIFHDPLDGANPHQLEGVTRGIAQDHRAVSRYRRTARKTRADALKEVVHDLAILRRQGN